MKFFDPIESDSDAIKARRWIGYWLIGLLSPAYRLELEHYKHCGKFSDID